MSKPKRDEESVRRALENLDELHRLIGEHTEEDERELQAILGDSPDEMDLMPVPGEKRLRLRSVSTPTH